MDELTFWIAIALVIDLAAGDPGWMPHPVRLIGRVAIALEAALSRRFGRGRLPGACLTALVVGGAYLAIWLMLFAAGQIDWRLAAGLGVYFLYASFAARDLDQHGSKVFLALKEKNIENARRHLALIVGRDTTHLGEKEVIRATVESVAEGTVDGVLSPLFFAALGGPPLAMAYKAANTLDSMLGHRSEEYLKFGWAAARLDDALNFVPARLARLFYPAAAFVCGLSPSKCWRISVRDGGKSPSPNAAISEAALAGALGIQVGGTNLYRGIPEARPRLGNMLREPEPGDIRRAILWMYASTVLGFVFFSGMRVFLLFIS